MILLYSVRKMNTWSQTTGNGLDSENYVSYESICVSDTFKSLSIEKAIWYLENRSIVFKMLELQVNMLMYVFKPCLRHKVIVLKRHCTNVCKRGPSYLPLCQ